MERSWSAATHKEDIQKKTFKRGRSLEITTRFTFNNTSAVPEPGAFALLMGTALGGGSLLLRRKQRNLR
jgi:hypothetical protein